MFAARISLLIALVVGASFPASAAEYILPKGVTVLSEEELLRQVVGGTISNENVTEFFEPSNNGEKKGNVKGKRTRGRGEYAGTWEVRGALMCFWYDVEYLERFNGICYSIGVKGDRFDLYNIDGSKFYPGGGPFKLRPGNADNL